MEYIRNAVVLVLMGMASCSSDELGPSRDVAYYMENEEERKAVIAKCENDFGRLGERPNCKNARSAQFKQHLGVGGSNAISDLPPIEELLRMPPPNLSEMSEEERARYRRMSIEEKDRYDEEQRRLKEKITEQNQEQN